VKNKLIVFSCSYNCEKYIKNHIESVQKQTYQNFIHIIVDDASTDNTYKIIQKYQNNNTIIYHNTKNQKWIKNAKNYLKSNSTKNFIINDNDIIILLDGDDFFAKKNVLEILNNFYNNNDCWITYSRMYYLSRKITSHWIPIYSKKDLEQKKFRNNIWSYTHLRTFRYFLWNHIQDKDLKDENGEYFKYCYDQIVCIPMLEMASPNHVGFIDDILVVYNDANPLSVEKIHRKEQENIRDYLYSKEKYHTLHF